MLLHDVNQFQPTMPDPSSPKFWILIRLQMTFFLKNETRSHGINDLELDCVPNVM